VSTTSTSTNNTTAIQTTKAQIQDT